MALTLVSPHLDDAALFSCGILLNLCAAIDLEIQFPNVFTHSGYAPFAGPSTAIHISELRKNEDAKLQSLVGGSLHFLDLELWDAPLRLHIPPEQTLKHPIGHSVYLQEVADLEKVFRPILTRAECVLLPMGFGGHIDRRIVRDASLGCILPETLTSYEDLLYAAHMNVAESARIIAELDPFNKLRPMTVRSSSGLAVKKTFASCYDSQIASSTVTEMVAYAQRYDGGENLSAGKDAARLLGRTIRLGNESPLNT